MVKIVTTPRKKMSILASYFDLSPSEEEDAMASGGM